jgi:uncharacterized protein (TIGR02996 family)
VHDEAGFLSAIRSTPADDTARLVFADWLDEQDDPLCKTKAEFVRLELRMAEVPERSLNRIRWLSRLEKLAVQLDRNWLAVVSHPKLEACRMRFDFECPAHWNRLQPTDDPKTRFCDTCKKNVHYCDTLAEAQTHATNGRCVALTVVLARQSGLVRPTDPPRAPPQLIRLTSDQIERLGRPSVAIGEMPRPVPTTEPVRRAGERPKWKQKRKKERRRNRNIQRENVEE